jgi:hypothetical protein
LLLDDVKQLLKQIARGLNSTPFGFLLSASVKLLIKFHYPNYDVISLIKTLCLSLYRRTPNIDQSVQYRRNNN